MITTSVRSTTSSGMTYERRGLGRPIIFIHGWCLNRRMWTYAEDHFVGSNTIVLPDLPGFGTSEALGGPYSLERYADEIELLIEEADLQDAVVVGFAFGAAVGFELAARADARLAGVVSVGIPTSGEMPYEKMPKAMRRDWPDFARRSAEALFHNKPSEATVAWLASVFAGTPLSTAVETVNILSTYSPQAIVSQVAAPVLFLQADNDAVSPLRLGEECARSAPQGRMEVVSDCGHLIVLDRKDAFHSAVSSFVQSL